MSLLALKVIQISALKVLVFEVFVISSAREFKMLLYIIEKVCCSKILGWSASNDYKFDKH